MGTLYQCNLSKIIKNGLSVIFSLFSFLPTLCMQINVLNNLKSWIFYLIRFLHSPNGSSNLFSIHCRDKLSAKLFGRVKFVVKWEIAESGKEGIIFFTWKSAEEREKNHYKVENIFHRLWVKKILKISPKFRRKIWK